MKLLLVLPILIPLCTAALCLVAWNYRAVQRGLTLAGATGLLVAATALLYQVATHGPVAAQMGNWAAPFGITLVADMLAALMVFISAIVGLTTAVYSIGDIGRRRQSLGYFPLFSTLLMGVCGAFLTGDIFNLYVWFEVLLISSFVLIALGGRRRQLQGAIKYVTLNLLSSALFLAAAGIIYGMIGTLNMADLALKLRHTEQPILVSAVGGLLLVAFGIKAAIFPLFFWLPASYPTPPVAVSAVFAGLLTKVGVYSLLRVFTLIFVGDGITHQLIMVLAAFTMVSGVLGAYAQNEFRRILSFHIVSQIGYMILGLAILTPLGLSAAIFYMLHNIVAKTNLYLISGVVHRLRGTFELPPLGGLYRAAPALGMLFLISALSLAGLPPLSGFFAKFLIVKAALAANHPIAAAVGLAVGVMTLLSMMKIWGEAFWKPAPQATLRVHRMRPGQAWLLLAPILAFTILTIAIGVAPWFLVGLCNQAGEQLMNPAAYISAVMEGRP
jgi:multicomponent Na+:H+ antiporter subunit D